jgi:hypothetical protein
VAIPTSTFTLAKLPALITFANVGVGVSKANEAVFEYEDDKAYELEIEFCTNDAV